MILGKGPNDADAGKERLRQNLLGGLKTRYPEGFSRENAETVHAAQLGLSGRDDLDESQKLSVGRRLSELSKRHDLREFNGRFYFPENKETLH